MILNDLRKALELIEELKELVLSLEDVETYQKLRGQIKQLESDINQELQWREETMLTSWNEVLPDER